MATTNIDKKEKSMKNQEPEIKIEVTFTEGYQTRFTEACIKQIDNRQQFGERGVPVKPEGGAA